MYADYSEVERSIEALRPFKGNSCLGYFNEWGDYVVKSYNTVIYQYNPNNGEWMFDAEYYSRTTSRLQNIIKRARNLD